MHHACMHMAWVNLRNSPKHIIAEQRHRDFDDFWKRSIIYPAKPLCIPLSTDAQALNQQKLDECMHPMHAHVYVN